MPEELQSRVIPSVVVRPIPQESARSFLIRASTRNGWPSLRDFMSRIGVSMSAMMARADPDDLAAAFGLPDGSLAPLPDRWSLRHVDVAGHRLRRDRIDIDRRRVCPHCLERDGFAHFEWEFNVITDCPEHGPLTDTCKCGKRLGWDDRHLAVCKNCHAEIPPRPLAPTSGASRYPFQQYCLGRLGLMDPTSCGALDPLPLDAAVDTVEWLGGLLSSGYSVSNPCSAPRPEKVEWRETGFSCLVGNGSRREFEEVVCGFRSATSTRCPKQPIKALGFFSDLPALHFRGNNQLVDFLKVRLGLALGYPVSDLWHTDYIDADWCALKNRLSPAAFTSLVHERGWLSSCHSKDGILYVPVDVEWQASKSVSQSRVSQTGNRTGPLCHRHQKASA